MTDMLALRSKIDSILSEGVLDGAAAKLNRLIDELRPWIEHLPIAETIERHLLGLVANTSVAPNGNPSAQAAAADKAAANERSKHALHIIRGYIRLREHLRAAGKDDLKAHMDALVAMKNSNRFDEKYIQAIFHP